MEKPAARGFIEIMIIFATSRIKHKEEQDNTLENLELVQQVPLVLALILLVVVVVDGLAEVLVIILIIHHQEQVDPLSLMEIHNVIEPHKIIFFTIHLPFQVMN